MKSSFIEVYDNILSTSLEDLIEQTAINQITYSFSKNIADSDSSKFYPGFLKTLHDVPSNYTDSYYFPFFSQVLYNFCFQQNIILNQIIRERLFITLPHSEDLSKRIHTDLEIPHWVLLYYVNNSDGDTIFFDNNKNEINRVSPKKGRMIFFDGSIFHAGSYSTKNERIGININFTGDFINKS